MRAILALAATAALTIGFALPVAGIGDTQVTLNCDDGTSLTVVVDADGLTALTQAVQAMLDYPAGLTCTLVQVPVVRTFGQIALASSSSMFVVGGGRWQASCQILFAFLFPGSKIPAAWASPIEPKVPEAGPTNFFINIAVNAHDKDGSVVGTLNETIPGGQTCVALDSSAAEVTFAVPEAHFTSKPSCVTIVSSDGPPGQNQNYPRFAYVTSTITHTSGGAFPLATSGDIHFSFEDNGNPGRGTLGPDMLDGPPVDDGAAAVCPSPAGATLDAMVNGNISVHP